MPLVSPTNRWKKQLTLPDYASLLPYFLLSDNTMAIRQQSASSTRIKRPRIQVVISEEVNSLLEDYAREKGRSISSAAGRIIEDFLFAPQQENNIPRTDVADLLRKIADLAA